jgi:YD repeat-containing protein
MTDRTKVRAASVRAVAAFMASTLLIVSQVATASETLSYSYDALGRLVKVARSGTVNNGASECYTYDKAGNRSNVTVATAADCAAGNPCAGISFTITSNGAVTEGANSVFTVTKTGSTSNSCTVNYATSNGTAVAPGDFTSASGTLTFTSAQTSQTVSIVTIDDVAVESAETFSTALSAPSGGATLGTPSSATATINDNDTNSTCSGISFSVSDASGSEGGTLVFTVTKAGSTSISCSVNYATANGTAIAGSTRDYLATSGTLTFTSGQSSRTVSVTANTDSIYDPDETMFLNLSGATSPATITDSQGVGTITDTTGCGSGC